MKRDSFSNDNSGPPNKRSRNIDDEVTFLIPSKVAGSIIGKGGTNISKLRSQFKASITVPDCPGPERVLTITSSDLDTAIDVVKEILPNLADQMGAKPTSSGDVSDDLDIRMLIHQSRAGCVIGKAGSKIKELREQTGARLKIFSNPAPQSTERVVQFIGNPEQVASAIREVLDLTRQTAIKGSICGYDPHNYDDFYAEEYGGFGGGQGRGGRGPARGPPPRGPPPPTGRGGMPPMRGGPPMGRNGPGGPRPPPFNDFGGPRGGNFGPSPRGNFGNAGGNFGNAGGNFGNAGGNFGNAGGNFGNAGGNFAGGNRGGGGGGPSFPDNDDNQPETSTQVTIPKDLAGAIIGKAGSRIRKIRSESGAGIEIAEPLPGSVERIITITGTTQRIQMAQYLLQQSVHESNPGLARGNY